MHWIHVWGTLRSGHRCGSGAHDYRGWHASPALQVPIRGDSKWIHLHLWTEGERKHMVDVQPEWQKSLLKTAIGSWVFSGTPPNWDEKLWGTLRLTDCVERHKANTTVLSKGNCSCSAFLGIRRAESQFFGSEREFTGKGHWGLAKLTLQSQSVLPDTASCAEIFMLFWCALSSFAWKARSKH